MAGYPSDIPGPPLINRTTPSGLGRPTMKPLTPEQGRGLIWLAVTGGHYGVWRDGGGHGLQGPSWRTPTWMSAVLKEKPQREPSKTS